jgi:hypothetical protein
MIYELEGSAKVGKREGLRKVVFLDDVPAVQLFFEGSKLLTLERWDATTAWGTGFGCYCRSEITTVILATERCHAQNKRPFVQNGRVCRAARFLLKCLWGHWPPL